MQLSLGYNNPAFGTSKD